MDSFFNYYGCNNKNNQNGKEDKVLIEINEIDSFLENLSKKDSLHGTVLIADRDNILLKKAYGFKDLNHSERHTIDNKIGLASMAKMFTAISIMVLKSEGKIDLDSSVRDYLPQMGNQFLKDSVTVRQLLSHTSGLGNYWDYTTETDQNNLDTLYHLIVQNDSLESHGNFRYSNSGFIILGKIIESVSGIEYDKYVKNKILEPLNMINTQSFLPDGGNNSTLNDLFNFSQALRSNNLVKQTDIEEMRTKQSKANYGLGFQLNFIGDRKIYGHPGGFFEENSPLGVASALDIIDDKYTVIVLTNRNPSMGGVKARNFILNFIAKKE